MKLVGKINIEVWDGDPNDPNSKLKQEVEEYNDVHPDMDNAWDASFYHRAWIDENWEENYRYTNPITGNQGDFKSEPKYFSIRLGFHNDLEKLSENLVSRASNTNLKYFDGSSYKQVGIDKKGYLYCSDGATNWDTLNTYIAPTQERLKLSEKSRKALDSLKSLYSLHVAVPIEEGSQYEYISRVSFNYQFSPTGEDFTIKNIGLYACYERNDGTNGDYPSRYITSNIKDSSIGITFHKFLDEIPVESTDYIKFNYVVDFITVIDIDPPTELFIKNKEGKDVRAIRLPVLLGFYDTSDDGTIKDYLKCWYDTSTPIQWRHMTSASLYSSRFSSICGVVPNYIGYFQQLTTTWDNDLRSYLKIEDNEEFLEEVKYMGTFNDNWDAISSRLFSDSGIDGVHNLFPVIGNGYYYSGISRGGASSITGDTRTLVASTLKSKIVKGFDNSATSTIHLKAVDDSDINHTFKGLVEIPFIPHYVSSRNRNNGYIAYLTVFEEPLEKTKFDELKVSKDVTFFNNKWGNPFNKDLSKSEEQE